MPEERRRDGAAPERSGVVEVDALTREMRFMGIDILFTLVPESEHGKIWTDRLPGVELITWIAGYIPDRLVGRRTVPLKDRPIDVETGGPLFGDAAGAYQQLATLPLADGYETVYRNFDPQKQKPKLMQLKVTGSESVTVAAGAFDAWKLELTPTDGSGGKTTVWVSKDKRTPVKISATLPELGGATLNAELLP